MTIWLTIRNAIIDIALTLAWECEKRIPDLRPRRMGLVEG